MKDAAQQAGLETSGQQDSQMPPAGESLPAEKAPCSLALSVLISSAPASMGRWQYEKAEIRGIAPDLAERGGEVERTEKDGSRIALWRGLVLHLRKESAESYWANVSGDSPRLFVACRREDGEVRPVFATASGEEAAGAGETDDEIFSAPMPGWMLSKVEAFVMAHYRPRPKHVRRRA